MKPESDKTEYAFDGPTAQAYKELHHVRGQLSKARVLLFQWERSGALESSDVMKETKKFLYGEL